MAVAFSRGSSTTSQRPTVKKAAAARTSKKKSAAPRILQARERVDPTTGESFELAIGNARMLSRAANVVNPVQSRYTDRLKFQGG